MFYVQISWYCILPDLESVHHHQLIAPPGLNRDAVCDFLPALQRNPIRCRETVAWSNVSPQQRPIVLSGRTRVIAPAHVFFFPLQSVTIKNKTKSITAYRDYHHQDYLQFPPPLQPRVIHCRKKFVPSDLNMPFSRPLRELWREKYKEW